MADTSVGEQGEGRPVGSGYVLEELIGAGSMGHVHRGRTRAGEPVAIKVLRPELTSDPAFVGRFLQEAQILTRISSPNTVAVRDLVAEGSQIAIVMDLVDGPDLRTELSRRGTVPAGIALWLVDQILTGVSAIHEAGIVHRDLKPENVLMAAMPTGATQPRITDFGVARIIEEGAAGRTTAVIGTPDYIAPEVADGREPTPASDLYAVGIMLYEMLTGVTPFAGGTPLAVMRRHVEQQPGRPDGLPGPLWEVIAGLLAKAPGARPGSAAQAKTALSAVAPVVSGMAALPRLSAPPMPAVDYQPTVVTERRVTTPLPQELVAEPAPEKRRRIPLVVGLLVAVLVAGGGTAYAMLSGKDEPATAASKPPATSTQSQSQAPPMSTSTSGEPTPSETSSVPAGVVPAVTGLLLDPAMTALQQAGLDVTIKEQLDEDSPDSTVMAQIPPAGAALPADRKAELTVARKAVGRYLADLEVVENQGAELRDEQVAVNGKTYVHAVWFSRGTYSSCDAESVQYDLGRHYRQFVSTAGLSDDSPSDAVVRMEVLADGRAVWTADLALGKTASIKLDVTGVLRLQLRVTTIRGGCGNDPTFADAQLFGVASEVPDPVETSQ